MIQPLTKISGPRSLLNRILGEQELVAAVQSLDARVLGQLINHLGLEDSGELVALASTEQLKKIFDDDLWQNEKPGSEEKFDTARFGLWLEIMFEMGPDFVAEKLLDMDEDFLTLALSGQVLVLNVNELELRLASRRGNALSHDELLEKALESSLNHEFEQYWIISRSPESWDVVLNALLALDTEQHDFLMNLLERCCFLSSEYIEDNGGLFQVLTCEEKLEADVAFDREQRREKEGFVPPQTAAAFLLLARRPADTEDHLTPAYFKSYSESAPVASGREPSRLMQLLLDAEVLVPNRADLLQLDDQSAGAFGPSLIRELLVSLGKQDPDLFSKRVMELTYLTNILIAGCSFQGRCFRPAEAAQAVLATCNLGLEEVRGRECDAVHLFKVGWARLYSDVVLASARAVSELLIRDLWMQEQVRSIALNLDKNIASGKPWNSCDDLDGLEAVLEPKTVHLMKELIGECPTVNGKFITMRKEIQKLPFHSGNGF